jgi:hypothetical protein
MYVDQRVDPEPKPLPNEEAKKIIEKIYVATDSATWFLKTIMLNFGVYRTSGGWEYDFKELLNRYEVDAHPKIADFSKIYYAPNEDEIYRYLLECLVIKITYLPPISF